MLYCTAPCTCSSRESASPWRVAPAQGVFLLVLHQQERRLLRHRDVLPIGGDCAHCGRSWPQWHDLRAVVAEHRRGHRLRVAAPEACRWLPRWLLNIKLNLPSISSTFAWLTIFMQIFTDGRCVHCRFLAAELAELDDEGRCVITDHGAFAVFNLVRLILLNRLSRCLLSSQCSHCGGFRLHGGSMMCVVWAEYCRLQQWRAHGVQASFFPGTSVPSCPSGLRSA